MPYQSGYAGDFDGYTRLELIQDVLRGLGSKVTEDGVDTTADYNRYPKTDIIKRLNDAQMTFVRKTQCLTSWAVVEAVADQAEYRLPRRCMKVLDGKYYTASDTYEQLIILPQRSYLKRISNTWKTDTSGTCEYLYPGNDIGGGNVKTFGVYPKPSSDGTTYTGSSMGVVTSTTDFSFSGEVTGTHKAGYANSAFLVDSAGRDFTTLGVTVGMMIFNSTDGSSGQITAIGNADATNDKISVTLAGGTDNDFDEADSFSIVAGEYGVVIRADGSEEYAFNSDFGELQDISPLSGNFLLEFVKRPLKLDSDNQYPEIAPDYHMALVDYCVWQLGRHEYNGDSQNARSTEALGRWKDAIDDFNAEGKMDVQAENFVEDREDYLE